MLPIADPPPLTRARPAVRRFVIGSALIAAGAGLIPAAYIVGSALLARYPWPLLTVGWILWCSPVAGALAGIVIGGRPLRWALVGWVLAGAVASTAGVAASTTLVWATNVHWGLDSFDPARWRASRTEDDGFNLRGKMVRRLLWSGTLRGRTRAHVLRLLGPPDCGAPTAAEDTWDLGMWSGFRVDNDCLHVCYDRSGRVASARVRQH